MTNNKIDSVKIIHDELNIREYKILSDFLRLVGIFVCNATIRDNKMDKGYDLVVFIHSSHFSKEYSEKLRETYEGIIFEMKPKAENEPDDRKYRGKVLEGVFDFIKENPRYIMNEDIQDWSEIKDVFLDLDYVKAKEFVYFRDHLDYAAKAQKVFVKIMACVGGIYKKIEEEGKRKSRYIDYAYLNLAFLVNETCSYLNMTFFFDNVTLSNLIEKSALAFKGFPNYYLLMAFLSELDPVLTKGAKQCYVQALSKMGNVSFANYAYYRFGKCCETVLKEHSLARSYYQKAYEANDKEYRACYKLGYYALLEKDYKGAILQYSCIADILSGKFEANTLQENEYEYLYKTFRILERIGMKRKDEGMRRLYHLKLNQLLDGTEKAQSNSTYKVLFSEEADQRLINTRKRLLGRGIEASLDKVFKAIAEA